VFESSRGTLSPGFLPSCCNQRLLRVDGGPSFIARKSAAVGGFLPFAETGSGDKIAPEAAIFRGAGSHRDEERDPRL
jgi:hypothetical protein